MDYNSYEKCFQSFSVQLVLMSFLKIVWKKFLFKRCIVVMIKNTVSYSIKFTNKFDKIFFLYRDEEDETFKDGFFLTKFDFQDLLKSPL